MDSSASGDSYSFDDQYGTYDDATHEAHINFLITEFYPTDDYYVSHISFADVANTSVGVDFSESPLHEPRQTIHKTTTNPDLEYPELDLDRIYVYAEPTNPIAPDGETLVTINYYARDNKSGLDKVDFRLRDPQGITHFEYHYHRNFYSNYFIGDPTKWEKYTINIILPKGSAPGIWGLAELTLHDKSLNWKTYNFVETLIFEPDNSENDYELFAEIGIYNMLSFNIVSSQNKENYNFSYRIVSEETGEEIKGEIESGQAFSRSKSQQRPVTGYDVDISTLPIGKLILIVYVKDSDNNVLAVRSTSLVNEKVGDVNRDRLVDIADAIGIVNKVVRKESATFEEKAADVNKDGQVDIADAIAVVNIVVRKADRVQTRQRAATIGHNALSVEAVTVPQGGQATLPIRFQFAEADLVSGFQFDLALPEGLSLQLNNGKVVYSKGD